MPATSSRLHKGKLAWIEVFVIAVGMILLGRSFDGPWVNWGQMIKALSLDAWNRLWSIDHCGRFMTPGECLAMAMTLACWNLLPLFSIWGHQLIDKWITDKNALALTETAPNTLQSWLRRVRTCKPNFDQPFGFVRHRMKRSDLGTTSNEDFRSDHFT